MYGCEYGLHPCSLLWLFIRTTAGRGDPTPPCTNTFRKYYRQYRIIEQEWFASKFCVLTRHSFAVILDVLPWNFGSADGTRARNRSQSQGTKFPQSAAAARPEPAQEAAAFIVRCYLKYRLIIAYLTGCHKRSFAVCVCFSAANVNFVFFHKFHFLIKGISCKAVIALSWWSGKPTKN